MKTIQCRSILFNFFSYIFFALLSAYVNANEEVDINLKETIFEYSSNSQRIEAIRQYSNKCISGVEESIELTGTIDHNMVLVIERLLTQLRNCELQPGNKKGIKIYLNSKGGRALDGVKLGGLFRKYNVKALIRDDHLCASACAFAFLGAKSRSLGNGAELLFHAPFKKKLFGISCDSRVNSQWLKDYFVEMLSDHQGEQLFDKTMSACGVNAGWVANVNYINTLE